MTTPTASDNKNAAMRQEAEALFKQIMPLMAFGNDGQGWMSFENADKTTNLIQQALQAAEAKGRQDCMEQNAKQSKKYALVAYRKGFADAEEEAARPPLPGEREG